METKAQEQIPENRAVTPIIALSQGNVRIGLGVSTENNRTLTELPDIRPLTPTNGVAAEARAATVCGSEDSPQLLCLPGGSRATPSISGTTAVGDDDDNASLESATSQEEFSPAFRVRIGKTAVSREHRISTNVC
jgi:hypothetical protein